MPTIYSEGYSAIWEMWVYYFLQELPVNSVVAGRDSVLRGSLEHGQVLSLLGNHRYRLYAA